MPLSPQGSPWLPMGSRCVCVCGGEGALRSLSFRPGAGAPVPALVRFESTFSVFSRPHHAQTRRVRIPGGDPHYR